jgi:hypothetical protein
MAHRYQVDMVIFAVRNNMLLRWPPKTISRHLEVSHVVPKERAADHIDPVQYQRETCRGLALLGLRALH